MHSFGRLLHSGTKLIPLFPYLRAGLLKGGGATLVYAPATGHWYPTIGLQVSCLKVNLGQREFSYLL